MLDNDLKTKLVCIIFDSNERVIGVHNHLAGRNHFLKRGVHDCYGINEFPRKFLKLRCVLRRKYVGEPKENEK